VQGTWFLCSPADAEKQGGVMEEVFEKACSLAVLTEAWKHPVLPSEVEQVLSGDCKIFRKERGRVEGEHLHNA
jgi:hypothetical protein